MSFDRLCARQVAVLCAGRHRSAIDYFLDSEVAWIEVDDSGKRERMFSYTRLISVMGDNTVPWAVREIFLHFMQTLYVDREPFDTLNLCMMVRLWPGVKTSSLDMSMLIRDEVDTFAKHTSKEKRLSDVDQNVVPFVSPTVGFSDLKVLIFTYLRDIDGRLINNPATAGATVLNFMSALFRMLLILMRAGVGRKSHNIRP